jgi:hypothetical protein
MSELRLHASVLDSEKCTPIRDALRKCFESNGFPNNLRYQSLIVIPFFGVFFFFFFFLREKPQALCAHLIFPVRRDNSLFLSSVLKQWCEIQNQQTRADYSSVTPCSFVLTFARL